MALRHTAMVEKIIKSSADYLVRSRAIEESEREVYEYGFHALYSNIANISFAIAVSLSVKMLPEAAIFHIAFIGLRNTAGGWHAPTRSACFAMSTAMLLASLCGIAHAAPLYAMTAMGGLSASLVWASAPIEHENSPLSEAKRERMKKLARILSTVFAAAIALTEFFAPASFQWAASPLAFGMASQSLLALAALASGKRKQA